MARGTLLCDLADQLEEHVDVPAERVPRIDREVENKYDIERVAEEVRRYWGLGLGPISNVVWLLERNGVIASYIPSDCVEADAFSGWRRTGKQVRPFVFLTDVKGAACRSRFDAAHELGHLVMHVDAQPGNPDLEQQANQFASALLMPRETFGREAPRWLNWDLIWELKQRWRTSARAILYRAHDFGMLSDASYRRGFVYLNQQFPEGEPYEPQREQPLLLREALRVAKEARPLPTPGDEVVVFELHEEVLQRDLVEQRCDRVERALLLREAMKPAVRGQLDGPTLAPGSQSAPPPMTLCAFGMNLHAATTADGRDRKQPRANLPLPPAPALRP